MPNLSKSKIMESLFDDQIMKDKIQLRKMYKYDQLINNVPDKIFLEGAVVKIHKSEVRWCPYAQKYIKGENHLNLTISWKFFKLNMGYAKLEATIFNDYGEVEFKHFRLCVQNNTLALPV